MLLTDAPATAVLPTSDLNKARAFYEGKLGLKVSDQNMVGGLLLEAGKGSNIFIYERGPSKAEHTAVAFMVDDIMQTMQELRDKGVVFEKYDMPGLKTDENDIADYDGFKSCWFKDEDNNILSIGQDSRSK